MKLPVAFLVALSARVALAQCADGSPPPCKSPARPAATVAAPTTSIAVLPFANRSPDTADVYIADGMTDEIANQLARIGRLQVRARSAVAAQWRRTPDPLDAARKLGVAWLVHGHVRHAGQQLLVNVELVRVGTGEEAWAARFPRKDADVFAVQAEVAESVSVAVGGKLSPREKAILAQRPTRSNEAYRLYLLGNALMVRRTPVDLRRAVDAYAQATRLDPEFAAAWARLAVASMVRINYDVLGENPDSIRARAKVAIDRAMALDPRSADAWLADGIYSYSPPMRDVVRAHTSLERAVQLDSLNEEAVGTLGFYHSWFTLDTVRGEPLIRRALALNPDRRISWLHLYFLRWYGGARPELASATLDTVQAMGAWGPAYSRRALERWCSGDAPGAIAAMNEAQRLDPGRSVPEYYRPLFAIGLGDSTPARAYAARLRARADTVSGANGTLARFYLALGRRAEALDAVEKAPRDADSWRELNSPCFRSLRSEPRFARFLESLRPR